MSNIISKNSNNTSMGSINKRVKIFKEIKEWDRYFEEKNKKRKKFML